MAEASKRKGGKPEIRFKGFDEEWYFCEFKQLVDRKSDISISSMVEPSVEYDDIVSGYGILNKDVRQKEIQKFGISFDVGDILYGKLRPYLKNWLLSNFSGVAVGDFWVLVPKNCENRCFYYFIQSDSFQKVSNQSTGTKMPRSDWALVSKATFALPLSCDEQKLIGEIFSNIDTLIINQQHKYDQLQNLKKAMLEKMFPRDGADVPEIRFKGFEGAWVQYKVSEITEFHKQGYYTTEPYGVDKKYYLLRGTDLTENRLILKDTPKINATENDYNAFKVEMGDFLIVRSGTVGTYGIVDCNIPAIFGSYLIDFRFNLSLVTNEFFGYFYQSNRFKSQLNRIIQQSANTNINAENIKSTCILLPTIREQQKIADYFQNLDNLISHQQKKLEHLKHLKAALLDKMFVSDGATA
ncbi:MAG: restriction endonuclease subunit S [Methanocorpusculum sp.]|nr:restriction endonuclease subunit S [Methanocorpusculum sp.]